MKEVETAALNGHSSVTAPTLIVSPSNFSPAALASTPKYGRNSEKNMIPVSGTITLRGNRIQGAQRVAPGAALADSRARREWVEDSGIPEHLFELNCFVGKDAQTIAQATKWTEKFEPKTGKRLGKKEIGLGALDLSEGYWYAYRYDWQKDCLDTAHGQFKTLATSYDVKGRQAKYLSSAGTGNAAYTLRVTEAEVRAVELRWGVSFPYEAELAADPEKVSQLYWRWVLKAGDVPVAVTEGIKKATCLLGQGIPAIALPGVNNIFLAKDASGIAKQLPDLRILRAEAKPVYLVFDSDLAQNANVKTALRKLAGELEKPLGHALVGADCRVCAWTNPKGIDDYFVAHGEEALSTVFAEAKPVAEWDEDLRDLDWYPHTLFNQIEKRFGKYFIAIGSTERSELYLYDAVTGAYSPSPDAGAVLMNCMNKIAAPSNDLEKAAPETTAGKPSYVREMISCIRLSRIIKSNALDPKGHWCTPQGVLRLKISGKAAPNYRVEIEHLPHAPYTGEPGQIAFTRATDWSFDPHAEDRELWRQLEFVPVEYQPPLCWTRSLALLT